MADFTENDTFDATVQQIEDGQLVNATVNNSILQKLVNRLRWLYNKVTTGTVNDADTVDGCHASTFATPENIATAINASYSHAGNGSERLPSGLIIKWGTGSAAVGPGSQVIPVSFATAFPNVCLGVFVNTVQPDTTNYRQIMELINGTVTASGFSVIWHNLYGGAPTGAYPAYIAIGY